MSKLIIEEPPLQVLPSLALAIGLNESIVLQQLHYLLRDPRFGRRIAEQQWIFNTVEEWRCQYFPFWSEKTIRRTFCNLSKLKLVEWCKPEGRISRRKYYRINEQELEQISDSVKMSKSIRSSCPDANRSKWALPTTKTTAKTSSKNTKGRFASKPPVCSFSPRFPYPKSEEEMYETLEAHGIETMPDYDGNFFETMRRNDWIIPGTGKRVYDWIATYEARTAVTQPGGGF